MRMYMYRVVGCVMVDHIIIHVRMYKIVSCTLPFPSLPPSLSPCNFLLPSFLPSYLFLFIQSSLSPVSFSLSSLACSRPHTPKTYLVHAGAEHEKFVNQFPFWVVNETVQEINCKVASKTSNENCVVGEYKE